MINVPAMPLWYIGIIHCHGTLTKWTFSRYGIKLSEKYNIYSVTWAEIGVWTTKLLFFA